MKKLNQDKIWDAYQNDPVLKDICWNTGSRIEYVAAKIPPGAMVLNIGVGQGKLEKLLFEKGVMIFSLDPSELTIIRIRNELGIGEEHAKVGCSQNIPFSDNTFDFVIMTEVLEHLDDDALDATLLEVKRVLRRSGKFIGTVPADENLEINIVVCPNCGKKFHRWGHVQSFSKDNLGHLLGGIFNNVYIKRIFFIKYSDLNWKGKIGGVLKLLQARLGIKGSNQNFYFEAYD